MTDLEGEISVRERFVRDRLDHRPEQSELMDLTNFMHGAPAGLLECAVCGLIVRDEPKEASYADDIYDPVLMKHLYPRYVDAFRRKAGNYRDLLRPGAEVHEIGSHLGGFLQLAEEWGWRPTGFDIGRDTSGFARRQGLRVKRQSMEDARIAPRSVDGIFVWNCFEQLEDPVRALRASWSALKRNGILVVRVPNFAYYERARRNTLALAYNNLLGFPYLTGYTAKSLAHLLRRNGFEPVAGLDSTLTTMPFPEQTGEIRREESAVFAPYRGIGFKGPGAVNGPWIELVSLRR